MVMNITHSQLAEMCAKLFTDGVAYGQPTYETIYKQDIIDATTSALEDYASKEDIEEVHKCLGNLPDSFSCY